ncbi:MAG: aminopeptidase [Clostridia bacterium]|nr:aminopeptidase [Clostridia bacterium]
MERENLWTTYTDEQLDALERFACDYRQYLDHGKTERECVAESVALAEAAGFRNLKPLIDRGEPLKAGDRVYFNWMEKSLVLFIVGEKSLQEGMTILGAHIDSPRIDVKQNPLYEEADMAYLDTHYYGYIKKYQWVARNLALHGVVSLKGGRSVTVRIGEEENDPVLVITDLLPHIADDQLKKPAEKVVEGEDLDILIAHRPLKGAQKEAVRAAILELLKREYGIEEADLISAELEAVPAGPSRDAGLDRSMIAAYGHDDRVCAYPSLRAMLDWSGIPARTLCCILTDKEEIGSYGATGMHAVFFENAVAELYQLTEGFSELGLRRALSNSRMLSSDVSSAFDPLYPSVFEKKNTAFLGNGVCFSKYTGSGGKGGSSDANSEFVAEIREIMDGAGVRYQFSEIGRVDVGGGGTIAHLCARYGMNVIDAGVPVLSMHAPTEIISKADLFEVYRCYRAFLGA